MEYTNTLIRLFNKHFFESKLNIFDLEIEF